MTPATKNQEAPKTPIRSISIIVAIGVMLLVAILTMSKNYNHKKTDESSLINPILATEFGEVLMSNQAINVENKLKAYEESLIAK